MKEIQADTISRQQGQTDLATLTGIYKQNVNLVSAYYTEITCNMF